MSSRNLNIKGMIFAAGLGTRLRPITDTIPKAMVEVGGKPMLRRVIDRFVEAGVTEIVVNIHHHADVIRRYIAQTDIPGVSIILSDETDLLLDTGGGILKARSALADADAVLVHNADILSDVDLRALIDAHIAADCEATLLVAPRQTSRYLYFDHATSRLNGWQNISTGSTLPVGFKPAANDEPLAFAGIHVFNPRIYPVLERYATDPVFSIIPFYVNYCRELTVNAYVQPSPYHWLDIGRPENLARANETIQTLRNT